MSEQQPSGPPVEAPTRAQAFARRVLEEMDRPKSPEREAYEAQKELEDREALTHLYRLTRQCKATAVEAVSTLAYKLKELPPDGPFREAEVDVEGLCGRKAVLRLGPSPLNTPFSRYIELTVFTPSGVSHSSQWLTCGTNAELAAFLGRETIEAEIAAVAEELVLSLERSRLM
jgi:hypothetical protein